MPLEATQRSLQVQAHDAGLPDLPGQSEPTLSQKVANFGEPFFLALEKGVTTLKGLQAILGKPGRSVESILNQIEFSMTDGWRNILKTVTTANGILSGLNIILEIPTMIQKVKEDIEVVRKVRNGDYSGVTFSWFADQNSFWLKQIANLIELVRFLESHRLYYLGKTSTNLQIVKSFADGVGNLFGIIHKSIQIHEAHIKLLKAHKTLQKWEDRIYADGDKQNPLDVNNWIQTQPDAYDKYLSKLILKNRLDFYDAALKSAKDNNFKSEDIKALSGKREAVNLTLMQRKIVKICTKPETIPEQKLAMIERKLWAAKIAPDVRTALLDIVKGKSSGSNDGSIPVPVTAQEKLDRLNEIHIVYAIDVKGNTRNVNFGLYQIPDADDPRRDIDADAKAAFEANIGIMKSKGLADTTNFLKINNDAQGMEMTLQALRYKDIDKVETGKAFKKTLENYVNAKIKETKEVRDNQKNTIKRSVVSIAFSVGLIGLVVLGLTLQFAGPGILSPEALKHLPFVIAGLGVGVSAIGLTKFIIDEVYKDRKNDKKRKIEALNADIADFQVYREKQYNLAAV